MGAINNPLILVEVIPIVRVSPSCDKPMISAPMAKSQLIRISRQDVFHPRWMQCRDDQTRRKGNSNGSNNEFHSTVSSGGMYLSIQHADQNSSIKRRCIVSGTVYVQSNPAVADSTIESSRSGERMPICHLKSDNPLCESRVPCILRGYAFHNELYSTEMVSDQRKIKCSVVGGTSVQVLPSIDAQHMGKHEPQHDLISILAGCQTSYSKQRIEQPTSRRAGSAIPVSRTKLAYYDKETVRALTLRMSIMLSNTTWIGTAPNALSFWKRHLPKATTPEQLDSFYDLLRRYHIDPTHHFNTHFDSQGTSTNNRIKSDVTVPYLLREGAMLLYNSHPHSGKTTLVTTIAKEVLECDAVHVLSSPAIFAKYGTKADAALETILHELTLRGAVKPLQSCSSEESTRASYVARICLVLDHFETYIDHGSNVDSYTPVFSSIASYLNRLSKSLKTEFEFPFPSSNSFYNKCDVDTSQCPGFVLPVGVCLIGVMTCADDDQNKHQSTSQLSKAFDVIGGGRMRLPLPSASTRLASFLHAFGEFGIELNDEAHEFLHELSASKSWAFGSFFIDVAKRLRSSVEQSCDGLVTKSVLEEAMEFVESNQTKPLAGTKSSFSILSPTASSPASTRLFESVGGNSEAKLALHDALALNPKKRRLLYLFGLHAPTGVLLYGPPGTGKTLLARAIAQAISIKGIGNAKTVSGSFISLKASDIVRPEIGNSEKLIVSAFDSARANAPSVVFIDEFQALFGDRDGNGVIVGQMATTLLQCMDEITRWDETRPLNDNETTQNKRIVVLGATNTPWMIDKAFLRPGRFDRAVHVGLPSQEEREEIIRVHSCNMKLAKTENVQDLCKSMARLCLGFSGADLAALCRAAAVRCLTEGDDDVGIGEKHYKTAFMHDVVPSSNRELVQRIARWKV